MKAPCRVVLLLLVVWCCSARVPTVTAAVFDCPTPATFPSAPPAGAVTGSLTGGSTLGLDRLDAVLWRESCPSSTNQPIVYLRVTPTAGLPFFCASDLSIVQNGTQFMVDAYQAGAQSSFCDFLHVPMTFQLRTLLSPQWDSSAALRLIFTTIYTVKEIDIASYAGAPSGGGGGSPGGGGLGITPENGMWWNPAESGTGYQLDVQHGVLVMTLYSYTAAGAPIWYIATGPIINNGFNAPLQKYANGQCISCAYVAPIVNGNDGAVSILFTSPTTGAMILPNGRVFNIVRMTF